MLKSETTLFITFPKEFRTSKKFGNWTLGSSGKNILKLKGVRKCDGQTDKKNIQAFKLIERIGPEGRCFENAGSLL